MKARCSERFLRGCLWGVRKLKEEDQIDIVLRRACQKLRINTQQGCFTDPDITKKYIERCYGQETWDAVRKEIAEASAIGETTLLLEEFAFGSTLPQDIALLNDIFSVDTEGAKYQRTDIKPQLFKHGKRNASGLRNTFVCRTGRGWVIAEYNAACKDAIRGGVPVEAPYSWFSKEFKRITTEPLSMPVYTELVDGVPKPLSTEPTDLTTMMITHHGYAAGIYDIMCHLITRRIIPDFEDNVRARWHNVWYFYSNLYPLSQSMIAQFASVSPIEVVYAEVMKKFAAHRKQRMLRLTYDVTDKLDKIVASDPVVREAVVSGVKSDDYRLGCEMLEVLVRNGSLLVQLFGSEDAEVLRKSFRGVFRTYCYTDFSLETLPNYVVCSKHEADISPYMLEYPEIALKGVAVVTPKSSNPYAKYGVHEYLLLNDALDGEALVRAITDVQPSSKIKLIYVGTESQPKILVREKESAEMLKANLEIFDFAQRGFTTLTDEAFRTSEVNTSGMLTNLIGSTDLLGSSMPQEEMEGLRAADCMVSWTLIYDAMQLACSIDDSLTLIRMDDPASYKRKDFHTPPYPMISSSRTPTDAIPIGATAPLTLTRLRPFYVMTTNFDSYYGLSSFGGAEIIVDSETNKPLLLKKSLFMLALGLDKEWIRECVKKGLPSYLSHYQSAMASLRVSDMWGEGVNVVRAKLENHEIQIAPISLHNLRTHTVDELYKAAERLTWSASGLWEVRRLVFREDSSE